MDNLCDINICLLQAIPFLGLAYLGYLFFTFMQEESYEDQEYARVVYSDLSIFFGRR